MSKTREQKEAKLLTWCQQRTKDYQGVEVKDFDVSWKDGLAFAALIHSHDPSLFLVDYQKLLNNSHENNVRVSFQAARKMGIPDGVLEVNEMLTEKPDSTKVITFLILLYQVITKSNELSDVIVSKSASSHRYSGKPTAFSAKYVASSDVKDEWLTKVKAMQQRRLKMKSQYEEIVKQRESFNVENDQPVSEPREYWKKVDKNLDNKSSPDENKPILAEKESKKEEETAVSKDNKKESENHIVLDKKETPKKDVVSQPETSETPKENESKLDSQIPAASDTTNDENQLEEKNEMKEQEKAESQDGKKQNEEVTIEQPQQEGHKEVVGSVVENDEEKNEVERAEKEEAKEVANEMDNEEQREEPVEEDKKEEKAEIKVEDEEQPHDGTVTDVISETPETENDEEKETDRSEEDDDKAKNEAIVNDSSETKKTRDYVDISLIKEPVQVESPEDYLYYLARALLDFESHSNTQLSFKKNDIIEIYERDEESGWWLGKLNGKAGWVPGDYFVLLEEEFFEEPDEKEEDEPEEEEEEEESEIKTQPTKRISGKMTQQDLEKLFRDLDQEEEEEEKKSTIEKVSMEGYLLIEDRKKWKKRWFILKGSRLLYFKEKPKSSFDPPLGLIPILFATNIETVNDKKKNKGTFEIGTSGSDKKYVLSSKNYDKMLEWVSALRDCKSKFDAKTENPNIGALGQTKEGMLEMWKDAKWKKRWFVLRDGVLTERPEKDRKKILTKIPLYGCTVEQCSRPEFKDFQDCTLEIKHSSMSHIIFLKAPNEKEMNSWLSALKLGKLILDQALDSIDLYK